MISRWVLTCVLAGNVSCATWAEEFDRGSIGLVSTVELPVRSLSVGEAVSVRSCTWEDFGEQFATALAETPSANALLDFRMYGAGCPRLTGWPVRVQTAE